VFDSGVDLEPTRLSFRTPSAAGASAGRLRSALGALAALAPGIGRHGSALAAADHDGRRDAYLDLAVALLEHADRRWASGDVVVALAFEGLEARVLEALVVPA
jgi:hypothetical protein